MARITLEIDDADVSLVLDAIGYTETVDDGTWDDETERMIPNPLTPMQYAQQWMVKQIKRQVRRYRVTQAQAQMKAELRTAIGVAGDEADSLGVR